MASIRLVIFEDNQAYRESLRQLFRFTPDIEVADAFSDCSQLQKAIENLRPDVILMDIDMPPGMNGIDATAIVKDISPSTQVVMLTVSEEEERIFDALRNGATGYLLKKTSPDELIESVRLVHRGGSPMTPAIARKVLQYFHLKTPPPRTTPAKVKNSEEASSSLSPREYEILEGLVDGLSYKMLAARHYISVETVKNHIQGIYRKLHIHSKSEAILYAVKHGIGTIK